MKLIQIRVDDKIKKDAEDVFEAMGLDTPTAVRIFLKKVVISQSIPFLLKLDSKFTPQEEEEILRRETEMDKNINVSSVFSSVDEMVYSLKKANED